MTIAEQTGYKIELINHSKVLMRFGGIGYLLRYLTPGLYC